MVSSTKIPFLWVWLVLVLAVTGCSYTGRHVQWYEGPRLNTNDLALLRIQRGVHGIYLHVNKINGKRLDRGRNAGNNTKEIELKPGQYDFSVGVFGRNGAHSTTD